MAYQRRENVQSVMRLHAVGVASSYHDDGVEIPYDFLEKNNMISQTLKDTINHHKLMFARHLNWDKCPCLVARHARSLARLAGMRTTYKVMHSSYKGQNVHSYNFSNRHKVVKFSTKTNLPFLPGRDTL